MDKAVVDAFTVVDPVKDGFYLHRKEWQILFDYYNSKNAPLSIGCRPCYAKVYFFIKKELAIDADGLNNVIKERIEEITNMPLDTPLYRPDA